MTDDFGTTYLAPTKSGGRVFNSKWHLGSPRIFYSTSLSVFDDLCFRGNTGTYVIGAGTPMSLDSTGEATFCMYGIAPRIYSRNYLVDGVSTPCNVDGYDPSIGLIPWNSHETTFYSLLTRNDCFQSYSGFTIGSFTNHIPDSAPDPNSLGIPNPKKLGDYSSRTGYGQIQFGGAAFFKKELLFPQTLAEASTIAKYPFNGPLPLNTWIGFKVICREYSNVLKNNIQIFTDMTNGLNGGDWKKQLDFTDYMGWSSQQAIEAGKTDVPQPSMVPDTITGLPIVGDFWTGAPLVAQYLGKPAIGSSLYSPAQDNFSIFIRNDYTNPIYGAQFYKKFSIHEVDELYELPPPSKQRNVNNLIDIFI